MIVWQALSPFKPHTTSTVEGSPGRIHDYSQCGASGEGSSMVAVAVVEKGLLLVFGALMAFSTRKVSRVEPDRARNLQLDASNRKFHCSDMQVHQ